MQVASLGRCLSQCKSLPSVVGCFLLCAMLSACDSGVQEVRIAAQDFRFDPSDIRLSASKPIRLWIVNEGREPHEFSSTLFADPQARIHDNADPSQSPSRDGMRILPGRAVTLTVQAPPGTYLFRCLVKGHAGMNGTLILE